MQNAKLAAIYHIALRNLLGGINFTASQFAIEAGLKQGEKMQYKNLATYCANFANGMAPLRIFGKENSQTLNEAHGDFSAVLVQFAAFLATLDTDKVDDFISELDLLTEKYTI